MIVKRFSLLVCVFIGVFAHAEMRTWTSVKGDTVDAEYRGMIGTRVCLVTTDGKTLKVPLSGLCRKDQEYLAKTIPPKIDIDVDVDKDTEEDYSSSSGSYELKRERVKCSVRVTKKSKEPCSQDLCAYMYLFAEKEKSDLIWIMADKTEEFSFKAGDSLEFDTTPASLQYRESGYSEHNNFRYEGYLVVVEDSKGEVVAMESNKDSFEKMWHKLKGAKTGNLFDRDYDLVEENYRQPTIVIL